MKKRLITVILIVAALILLYISNPEKKDYENFIDNQISEKIEKSEGFAKIGESLSGGVEGIAIKATGERRNYKFFSVYEGKGMDGKLKYIGFAKIILKLQ